MKMNPVDFSQCVSLCMILSSWVALTSAKPVKRQRVTSVNREQKHIILDALRSVSDIPYPTLVWSDRLANETSAVCRFQTTTDTTVIWEPDTMIEEAEYIGAVAKRGSFAEQARASFAAWKKFNLETIKDPTPGAVRYNFQDQVAMRVGCSFDARCKIQCNYNPRRCQRDNKYFQRTFILFACVFQTLQ